ncbi:DUF1294 domain-containing protein [Sporomusa acidovorans]|uniref:DUF1294 domain-containing protein n=1 Tax=Sporomusa acidovorans (strain ATCC 49682 / DSM 3132 / Mol) TaxID=1123286 RepID=A0ABZ3J605_SPOA4|nr:DUF1294 domain-containing protein [Sporomusa acidovorans]OZC15660.1 hypothetical protein SPACI_47350 [Sporomusa acidovorans DSM 3132]SDE88402.1 Uncharacterized membrane protein YsdA, DUF1294 family [Sporomusa acidovorans]
MVVDFIHKALNIELALYFCWNLIAFVTVWADKCFARIQARRIRERTFFLIALLFGAAGVLIGMYVHRHKTLHQNFVIGIPILFFINIFCLYMLWK